MKHDTQIQNVILTLALLITLVMSGCAGRAPSATPSAPAAIVDEVVEVAKETQAPMPTALPTATVASAPEMMAESEAPPEPSTGGSAEPNDQPYGDMFFEDYGVNPFIDTEDDHLSTFAVDVDTASYTVMRRYIRDGFLPPDESVRVEEYVNFFEQDYAPPQEGAFAIHLEGAPSLYGGERYHLVRVGLQGYEVAPEDRQDVVLTFVIDVSGSMDMENRLELVKDALSLLVESLRPTDRVGIVVYGSEARVVLEHMPIEGNYRRIFDAINSLTPSGSTYAEAGLVTGYQLAQEAFDPQALNRVILCSDGVANVGRTGPDSILARIREYADAGIYMTSVGFGMGNFNDVLMEQLADNGDGFYAYVDDIKEAERVFVHDLTSTLHVIARDAKIQVDFNSSVVSRYRLLGYENRDVADADFRNDAVDAGEVGAGHSVTALYEVKFHEGAPSEQPALTVYVRYEDPGFGEVVEINRSLGRGAFADAFTAASPRFQLTAIVAEYAEILRDSYWAKDSSLGDVAREAARIAEYLPQDEDVQEFADLVERAAILAGDIPSSDEAAAPQLQTVSSHQNMSVPVSVIPQRHQRPRLRVHIARAFSLALTWIHTSWQQIRSWI